MVVDCIVTLQISAVAAFISTLFVTSQLFQLSVSALLHEASQGYEVLNLWRLAQSIFGKNRGAFTFWLWVYPAFFTSIWLWLYAGSGFLLKAARRFDAVVNFMSKHMDIEHKPLQSIGLVSGVVVVLTYWIAVIVKHIAG
jgi:hypothetical protein